MTKNTTPNASTGDTTSTPTSNRPAAGAHVLEGQHKDATMGETSDNMRKADVGGKFNAAINFDTLEIGEDKVLIVGKGRKDGEFSVAQVPADSVTSRWNKPLFRYGMMALAGLVGGGAGFLGGKKYGEVKTDKRYAAEMQALEQKHADALNSMTGEGSAA